MGASALCCSTVPPGRGAVSGLGSALLFLRFALCNRKLVSFGELIGVIKMSPERDSREFDKLEQLVDSLVCVCDCPADIINIRNKIDLLERALEFWRISKQHLENEVSFETFVQAEMLVDGNRLLLSRGREENYINQWTRPIQLQPRLLMFLLLYHRQAYDIYSIIENFVDKIWYRLATLDFKRTRTGVIRCFTNTRFAAKALRDYGFLKYTQKQAYKTWVLSLPGFLTASKILQEDYDWGLTELDDQDEINLCWQVLHGWRALEDYDQFIARLAYICEPNTGVFQTFESVLRKAHELLADYWQVLQTHDVTRRERKAESNRLLMVLEQEPQMEKFYEEFSACVNVERLLADADRI